MLEFGEFRTPSSRAAGPLVLLYFRANVAAVGKLDIQQATKQTSQGLKSPSRNQQEDGLGEQRDPSSPQVSGRENSSVQVGY